MSRGKKKRKGGPIIGAARPDGGLDLTEKDGETVVCEEYVSGEEMDATRECATVAEFLDRLDGFLKRDAILPHLATRHKLSLMREGLTKELDAYKHMLEVFETASEGWSKLMGMYLKTIRDSRMAIGRETSQIQKSIQDLHRTLEQYPDDLKLLSEYVSVCERLQAVQESGVMEAVADILVRLRWASSADADPNAKEENEQ